MKKTKLILLMILTAFFSCTDKKEKKKTEHQMTENVIQYVNPFIGTAGHGHTFPGAALPFGMIQLSPDNGTEGWDWCSGYNYADSTIAGFSHLHLSGTGIGDLYDILFMPVTGSVEFPGEFQRREAFPWSPTGVKNEPMPYWSKFSHDNEKASPAYYSVKLDDYNIKAELTVTPRVGLQRYTYPKNDSAAIVLDLGHSLNWDFPVQTSVTIVNDSLITGYRYSEGWAEDQRVYFATQFSKPFKKAVTFINGKPKMESKKATSNKVKAVFYYDTEENEQILVKTGISSASVDGAIKNIETELPHWNFDVVKQQGEKKWQEELAKIHIETRDKSIKRTFYTALYHSFLVPYLYSDAAGEYKAPNGKTEKANGFDRYTVFSLWDTFRAVHPLFTIVQTEKTNDFIQSFLSFYNEQGHLPVWALAGNETYCMIGNHAIPVITDAYFKGIRDFDAEVAYAAMRTSVMRDTFGMKEYRQFGYVPLDLENYSVSRTLEYAYNDWCMAKMAEKLGKDDDYEMFSKRAKSYMNIFDSNTGFMRAKHANGTWDTPFDPFFSEHNQHPYTEGNAWQYIWFVPHDVQGLISVMGGKEAFTAKLDSLFMVSEMVKGEGASIDISGMIGQYAHGNEPSHHIAYLYNYAGEAWKTQERVSQILRTLYSDKTDGLCGNEDCGQMSAWYVFSSLGFYPVNPAEGIYVIGSPLVEKAKINVGNNTFFEIIAENVSDENKYIQSAELNGKSLNRSYITHDEIMSGGTLKFVMGNKPDKTWASDETSCPPSMKH